MGAWDNSNTRNDIWSILAQLWRTTHPDPIVSANPDENSWGQIGQRFLHQNPVLSAMSWGPKIDSAYANLVDSVQSNEGGDIPARRALAALSGRTNYTMGDLFGLDRPQSTDSWRDYLDKGADRFIADQLGPTQLAGWVSGAVSAPGRQAIARFLTPGRAEQGAITLGDKTYPSAYFHRSVNPEELPFMQHLIDNNLSTEQATSVISPEWQQTFREGPGLLYNGGPDEIKAFGTRDFWSTPTSQTPLPDVRFLTPETGSMDALNLAKRYVEKKLDPVLNGLMDRWNIENLWKESNYGEKGSSPLEQRFEALVSHAHNKWPFSTANNPQRLEMLSRKYPELLDKSSNSGEFVDPYLRTLEVGNQHADKVIPSDSPLDALFSGQAGWARDELRHFDPDTNETILRTGGHNIAGVSIPEDTWPEFVKPFQDFAERNNLPIYRLQNSRKWNVDDLDNAAMAAKSNMMGTWEGSMDNLKAKSPVEAATGWLEDMNKAPTSLAMDQMPYKAGQAPGMKILEGSMGPDGFYDEAWTHPYPFKENQPQSALPSINYAEAARRLQQLRPQPQPQQPNWGDSLGDLFNRWASMGL